MPSVLDRDNPRVVVPVVAGIGNALMAVPLVRQLKRALPKSHITIVARIRPMGEVFERLPEVDEVRLMRKGSVGMARGMLDVARPDVCLIPFPSNRWQYVMLALASGAKRRVMHSYPVGAISALGFVPADRLVAVRGLHDVLQNLYLLRLMGIEPDVSERPEFIVEDGDRDAADRMLANAGIDREARPVAVHVGSAQTILAQAKRWPAQNYADLIRHLRDRYGDRVVLLEGPDEAGVANEVAAHHPEGPLKIVRLTGPLAHAAALLERSEFYAGTDSGLAHLAAAVGTPPVTLFAPADPERVCPYRYRHLVVQPRKDCCPCFQYPWQSTKPKMSCRTPMCITEIRREDVLAAVERAVEMRAAPAACG